MLVYDITNLESFQSIKLWLFEKARENVYKILIGNKCDLESERKVTVEQGKDFAAKYGMKFYETSVKNSTNVSEAFITMTRDIIELNNKNNAIALNKIIALKKYINF